MHLIWVTTSTDGSAKAKLRVRVQGGVLIILEAGIQKSARIGIRKANDYFPEMELKAFLREWHYPPVQRPVRVELLQNCDAGLAPEGKVVEEKSCLRQPDERIEPVAFPQPEQCGQRRHLVAEAAVAEADQQAGLRGGQAEKRISSAEEVERGCA